MKQQQKNNYAFIDSQNVNLAVRSQKWILDMRKFRVYLRDKMGVDKAYLFMGFMEQYQDMYKRLESDGYVLVFKPVLPAKEDQIKGNVDAELVLHTMIEYKNFGQAVIASGDGDFFCLLEYLERKGKLLKLVVPNRKRYSSLLRKFTKKTLFLTGMKAKLGYKKQTKKERH